MNNFSLSDIISLAESVTLECKAAQGRDGKGEVPASFWETYSAMANTNGAEVYLGIEEKPPGVFRALGIKEPEKLKKSFWDMLIKEGETRASVYYLPGQKPVELPLSFLDKLETSSPDLGTSSHDLSGNSQGLNGNSPYMGTSSPDKRGSSPDIKDKLAKILAFLGFTKMPRRMKVPAMRTIILQMCDDRSVTLKELSSVLERDSKALQDQYLTPMLSEGLLELKYPDNKNHPNQAYRRKR
jgi:hypothetical protein